MENYEEYDEMIYEVDRSYQSMFCDAIRLLGCDGYGSHIDSVTGEYENDVFAIRPYYWGDDESRQELPNFEYKTTGFKLNWYKYPLRCSYMNQEVDMFEVIGWIRNECKESMITK
jgi:hypothetical protein